MKRISTLFLIATLGLAAGAAQAAQPDAGLTGCDAKRSAIALVIRQRGEGMEDITAIQVVHVFGSVADTHVDSVIACAADTPICCLSPKPWQVCSQGDRMYARKPGWFVP